MKLPVLTLSLSLLLGGCATVIDATSESPIEENPTSRTTGSFIDDEIIETKSLVNLNKVSEQLKNAHLSVVSYNGVVLLAGQVATEQARQLAEKTVREVRKVRVVHNELTVSGPTSAIVRTNDAWLTTKLKTKMLAEKNLDSGSIKVVTENGVVYLLGLVRRIDADHAVAVARGTSGVQKVVKMFEYVD
ncbi:BON domain-containing protein [Motiliproteus sediminis]|uniref:BON domain-containing protein n=1 Tax=Motiliproteus sediminis TaxID=1468178 RepID=UPI001AEF7640|nr:BON domain-containing protein [Motiliproteus sediminis]